MKRLLVLSPRVGIRDDASTGLDVSLTILDHHRSDRDSYFQIAIEAKEPRCAGIRSTFIVLELGNDLHRPNLWCAGDCTRRKAGSQGVNWPHGVSESALHIRDEVH